MRWEEVRAYFQCVYGSVAACAGLAHSACLSCEKHVVGLPTWQTWGRSSPLIAGCSWLALMQRRFIFWDLSSVYGSVDQRQLAGAKVLESGLNGGEDHLAEDWNFQLCHQTTSAAFLFVVEPQQQPSCPYGSHSCYHNSPTALQQVCFPWKIWINTNGWK